MGARKRRYVARYGMVPSRVASDQNDANAGVTGGIKAQEK